MVGVREQPEAESERCTIWRPDRGIGKYLCKMGCFLLSIDRTPGMQTLALIVDPWCGLDNED